MTSSTDLGNVPVICNTPVTPFIFFLSSFKIIIIKLQLTTRAIECFKAAAQKGVKFFGEHLIQVKRWESLKLYQVSFFSGKADKRAIFDRHVKSEWIWLCRVGIT